MTLELHEPTGATPLTPDELLGLKAKHITTRGELNELEGENIIEGLTWLDRRPKSFDMFEENNADLSAVKSASWGQSSPSRAGSPSPKRPAASTRLDVMKTGGRDLNTTGFELKSIGESDGRGRPVSFKDPPMLRGSLAKKTTGPVAKDAPTAENLRRLNTKTGSSVGGGPRSDGGKSARRSEISIGRFSRTSA